MKNQKSVLNNLLDFISNVGKVRANQFNVTNVYENHKLIIYMRNGEYFGIWVHALFLDTARERFSKEPHLIVNNSMDGAMFLKILVKNINIVNEEQAFKKFNRENF